MDEDEVRPAPAVSIGRDLRTLSVADLEAYVEALRGEIERVRAEIARRQDVRGAAEALFRRPPADPGGEPG
jgi:uncharacterized small protein (DUF1192 family)